LVLTHARSRRAPRRSSPRSGRARAALAPRLSVRRRRAPSQRSGRYDAVRSRVPTHEAVLSPRRRANRDRRAPRPLPAGGHAPVLADGGAAPAGSAPPST
jgi:hypothetical protein